jgi:DnaJ domain
MKNYLFRHCLMVYLLIATHNFHGMHVEEGKATSAKPAKAAKSGALRETAKKLAIENSNAQRQAAGLPPLAEATVLKKFEAAEQAKSLDLNGKPEVQATGELDLSVLPDKTVKKSGFSLPKHGEKTAITSNSQSSEPSLNMNINPLARTNRPFVKQPAKTTLSSKQQAAKLAQSVASGAKSLSSAASYATGSMTQGAKSAASRAYESTVKSLGNAKDFVTGRQQLDLSSWLSNSASSFASSAKSLGDSAMQLASSAASSASSTMSRAGQAFSGKSTNSSAAETKTSLREKLDQKTTERVARTEAAKILQENEQRTKAQETATAKAKASQPQTKYQSTTKMPSEKVVHNADGTSVTTLFNKDGKTSSIMTKNKSGELLSKTDFDFDKELVITTHFKNNKPNDRTTQDKSSGEIKGKEIFKEDGTYESVNPLTGKLIETGTYEIQANGNITTKPSESSSSSTSNKSALHKDIAQAYKTLGLSEDATTKAQVTTAYKNLSLRNHPDKGGDVTKFQEIGTAYETLKAKFEKESPAYNMES